MVPPPPEDACKPEAASQTLAERPGLVRRSLGKASLPLVSPSLAPAMIAGIGCALPLILGVFTGHSGFLWASLGAFLTSQANPLQRLGMLRMLLLILLGALGAGLGFTSAKGWLATFALFFLFGLLLAWLQRFGRETGKFGTCLGLCICLGHAQYGQGNLHNASAVGMLFMLGGLWVALLGFGLRGLHGLRMWPYLPRLRAMLRALSRHARRLPRRQWRLHAIGCAVACGAGGSIVYFAHLPRGYWLTLAVVASLQMHLRSHLLRPIRAALSTVAVGAALIFLAHAFYNSSLLLVMLLSVIVLCRAFQANRYSLYAMQTAGCTALISETLSSGWQMPQTSLVECGVGALLALAVAWALHVANWRLGRSPADQRH
jgi:hypothetical protein